MLKVYSNIDTALVQMKAAMQFTSKQLFITWVKYGSDKTEYRLCTAKHVMQDSIYTLYQTERNIIVKNVKSFNYYRKWKQNK